MVIAIPEARRARVGGELITSGGAAPGKEENMAAYANPQVLVSTQWADDHRGDPKVRIVEVDVDTKAYEEGHIPGAIGWSWNTQLCDTVQRDIIPKGAFEKLMAASGIDNATIVVLYGDNNNWFAADRKSTRLNSSHRL